MVHFAHVEACGLSWRVTASCPSRGCAACGEGDCVAWLKEIGDRSLPRKKLAKGMAKSDSLRVWVRPNERKALQRLAESMGEKPSHVVRRVVREAITGGPEYFNDGLKEIRAAHRELAAVGRNINQLAKAANRDERVVSKDLRRNLAAAKQQVDRLTALYGEAVERVQRRNVDRVEL